MISNFQEDTVYNIIKKIVSDKKRTIFTQSFPIEENFIFEHVINDIYNFNIVYHEEDEIAQYNNFNLDNIKIVNFF